MHSNRMIPAILLLFMFLAGCIGTTPPAQFYLLEPMDAAEQGRWVGENAGPPVVALAPVRMPKYVDRPQIVTGAGRNAYKLSELNRWAEPLDGNIARVLAQNLGVLVPAEVVLPTGSSRSKQAAVRVSVHILEFHVDLQGVARLAAQWNIARGGETVLRRQSSYRVPASTTDYRAMVEGLNDGLNRLSRDLAAALRQQTVSP
jgi:uncharacterized lipoprotein YmbA